MSRVSIIPAILPKDFNDLEEKLGLINGATKIVQIDVCDGQFVANATWPYRKTDLSFNRIINEEEGLPYWQDVDYEIDLMANNPEHRVDEWVRAGVSRIIMHSECRGDIDGAIKSLAGRVEIGLAFGIDSDLDALSKYADSIQCVQLMGIDNIGFQNQKFDDRVLDRINSLRVQYPSLPISVDGGVSMENAPSLIQAGVSRMVIGSAIFASDNPIEAISKFKNLS